MQGGTYARALKVGFNEEQAIFLSHLGMDTRAEAVQEVLETLDEEGDDDDGQGLKGMIVPAVVFACGFLLGRFLV